MVALAIMGIALVSVFQLFSLSLRSAKKAEDYTRALSYARSLLDEAYALKDIEADSDTFDYDDGFRASREITEVPLKEEEKTQQYRIEVTVTWPPRGKLTISGLRTVYDKPVK
ncbi:MAG: hypothetical protein OHK006_12230 [Thermodesulfovibrionales bacterium]